MVLVLITLLSLLALLLLLGGPRRGRDHREDHVQRPAPDGRRQRARAARPLPARPGGEGYY